MSATNRGAVRIDGDRYYTSIETARACVATLDLSDPMEMSRAIEPSVGRGAFVRALREARPGRFHVTGIDIDPGAEGLALADCGIEQDWLAYKPDVAPDLVLGNPPYQHAEAHLAHALAVVRHGGTVAFLLRLAFLESAKRAAFWRTAPLRKVYVLSERPSFTSDGKTDSAAYAWYIFERGYQGKARLGWVGGSGR